MKPPAGVSARRFRVASSDTALGVTAQSLDIMIADMFQS